MFRYPNITLLRLLLLILLRICLEPAQIYYKHQKHFQPRCCLSHIHKFLIYHSYSTGISFCNFLKASINYEEYILLVTKYFKLGGNTVKFFFNIFFIFLKYNTKKRIFVFGRIFDLSHISLIDFNVSMLSVKYIYPAWKVIL